MNLLKSWGIRNTNANSIIRVLKTVDLVSGSNEPTPRYEQFMQLKTGPAALGSKVKDVYRKFFEASAQPYKEPNENLRNLFNIHSGGSSQTIDFQIQTFKALCDYSTFDGEAVISAALVGQSGISRPAKQTGIQSSGATIHIDLHIHLPENKARRDYEYIFEDIGKYLLGSVGAEAPSETE